MKAKSKYHAMPSIEELMFAIRVARHVGGWPSYYDLRIKEELARPFTEADVLKASELLKSWQSQS